jgi:formamidopyrimidine-DNA glycosylase
MDGCAGQVPSDLPAWIAGKRIERLSRRSKYLLIDCGEGWLILHLGMSGSLRVVPADLAPGAHDHVDLVLESGQALRLRDPRRFGAVLFEPEEPMQHKLLRGLGPSRSSVNSPRDWLYAARAVARRRSRTCSWTITSSAAWEHLRRTNRCFAPASIRHATPDASASSAMPTGEGSARDVAAAIRAGGSTLRDFVHADGSSGYFQQQYLVYGREGEPCKSCARRSSRLRIGQRSAFYCPRCQR